MQTKQYSNFSEMKACDKKAQNGQKKVFQLNKF